jgi:hypothetical protein
MEFEPTASVEVPKEAAPLPLRGAVPRVEEPFGVVA